VQTGRWQGRLVVAASMLALLSRTRTGEAAELGWSAPPDCARAEFVATRVEDLVGRPLAEVEGLDFGVTVERDGTAWKLSLATRVGSEPASSRVFTGQSCSEVSDAAAVAMAMAIRGSAPVPPANEPTDEPPIPPAAASSPAPPPRDEVSTPPQQSSGSRWSGRVGLGAVLDTAALPEPTVGILAGGAVHWSVLRIEGQFEAFAPQRVGLPGGASGQFDLLAGALLACAAPAGSPVAVLGCGGLELGRLSGEGSGVSDPELGTALWIAARAEAGLAVRVGAAWQLVPRVGVAIPLARPEFVLNDSPVHRPAALSLRAGLGIEFVL